MVDGCEGAAAQVVSGQCGAQRLKQRRVVTQAAVAGGSAGGWCPQHLDSRRLHASTTGGRSRGWRLWCCGGGCDDGGGDAAAVGAAVAFIWCCACTQWQSRWGTGQFMNQGEAGERTFSAGACHCFLDHCLVAEPGYRAVVGVCWCGGGVRKCGQGSSAVVHSAGAGRGAVVVKV